MHDINMNIIFNWAKEIDPNVVSLEKWPGEDSFYKIRDIYHVYDGDEKYNPYKDKSNIVKCISFHANSTIGMIQTFNLPITDYKKILRESNLNNLI